MYGCSVSIYQELKDTTANVIQMMQKSEIYLLICSYYPSYPCIYSSQIQNVHSFYKRSKFFFFLELLFRPIPVIRIIQAVTLIFLWRIWISCYCYFSYLVQQQSNRLCQLSFCSLYPPSGPIEKSIHKYSISPEVVSKTFNCSYYNDRESRTQ